MASHARVLNMTTGATIKRSQALRLIEHGVAEWIEEGFKIRRLSLPEMVIRRAEIAQAEEPLAYSEIPGIRYDPLPQNLASTSHCRIIATASSFLFGAKIHMLNNPDALQIIDQAANKFCLEHA